MGIIIIFTLQIYIAFKLNRYQFRSLSSIELIVRSLLSSTVLFQSRFSRTLNLLTQKCQLIKITVSGLTLIRVPSWSQLTFINWILSVFCLSFARKVSNSKFPSAVRVPVSLIYTLFLSDFKYTGFPSCDIMSV